MSEVMLSMLSNNKCFKFQMHKMYNESIIMIEKNSKWQSNLNLTEPIAIEYRITHVYIVMWNGILW